MTFLNIYLVALLVITVLMSVLWLISLVLRDSSIVDIFWGSGFVVLAWLYFFLTEGAASRQLLVVLLVTVWGLRLTLHLGWRNIGKGEDFRYRRWREEAGSSWWWQSYLRVFLLQGTILWIVSAPLLAAQISPEPALITLIDLFGVAVWLVGFVFEAVGDWQLTRFKSDPANEGKVLDSGLWRYTRHPNYFGDAAQWWGFWLFALAAGGWWTVFSPILMTILLVRVSGVVMLERTLADTKPAYRDYVRRTSAFLPRPPKDEDGGKTGADA